MSMVNGNFSIKCNNCGTQHDFPANEAEFEFDGGEERQMGAENSYSWNSSFTCDNDCDNEIEFEYGIWEYPVGAYNNDSVEITNGTEIERYSYDFSEEPEPEDL